MSKLAKIYKTKNVYGGETDLTNSSSNRLEKMIRLVKGLEVPPKSVLDLGCGTGYFAARVKEIYPEASVTGADISKEALVQARKKYGEVEFVLADVEAKLPFRKNCFDLIISGENIEHIIDTDMYLVELNRVLVKGGSLIITTPNLASWMNRVFLFLGRQPYYLEPSLRKTLPIIKIGNYTFPEDLSYPASGHLRLFTLDALKKLVSLYGFRVEKSFGYTMLRRPVLAQLDRLFSLLPGLAFGLVVRSRKIK